MLVLQAFATCTTYEMDLSGSSSNSSPLRRWAHCKSLDPNGAFETKGRGPNPTGDVCCLPKNDEIWIDVVLFIINPWLEKHASLKNVGPEKGANSQISYCNQSSFACRNLSKMLRYTGNTRSTQSISTTLVRLLNEKIFSMEAPERHGSFCPHSQTTEEDQSVRPGCMTSNIHRLLRDHRVK